MSSPVTVAELFRDTMAGLCSGVAVLTTRRNDASPCGLLATSLSAFSATPPSVLTSIGHTSRCYHALAESEHFGVHILRADQERLAHVFSSLVEDKFEGLDWSWDADVPELADTIAYLRCRRESLLELYDHSIVLGVLSGGGRGGCDRLVYLRR